MGPVTYHLPQQGTYTLPVPYLHRITYASERYASYWIVSLHIRSMWETFCDAQAGFWLNSKFLSKFSRKPLSGISDQKAPPFRKTSDLRWPKFTSKYPPILENFRFEMTTVYSEIPPHFGKVQIWDDQSLLRNTPPPISENFRFEMTKVYSKIPPPPFRKTSDLRWPKFTPKYPPPPFQKIREIVCGD